MAESTPKATWLGRKTYRKKYDYDSEDYCSDEDDTGQEDKINYGNESDKTKVKIVPEIKKPAKANNGSLHFQYGHYLSISVSVVIISFFTYFWLKSDTPQVNNSVTIQFLKQKYGNQEKDFWISFEVLIQESLRLKQPKCLILLHHESISDRMELMLGNMARYAVCQLRSCTSVPILLKGSDFSTNKSSDDYGKIIVKYEKKLKENGVMVVKNIENIFGKSALVFQSFCDEYQPVVETAVFLLTVNINKSPQNKAKYLETILKQKWNYLSDDLFYPLLTRISNFIFTVTL